MYIYLVLLNFPILSSVNMRDYPRFLCVPCWRVEFHNSSVSCPLHNKKQTILDHYLLLGKLVFVNIFIKPVTCWLSSSRSMPRFYTQLSSWDIVTVLLVKGSDIGALRIGRYFGVSSYQAVKFNVFYYLCVCYFYKWSQHSDRMHKMWTEIPINRAIQKPLQRILEIRQGQVSGPHK